MRCVGRLESRRDEARSSALKGAAVEPSVKRVDSLPLWEELSFLAFSFRGGVRPCFPCWVACHRFATRAMRFQGFCGISTLKFNPGIANALQC